MRKISYKIITTLCFIVPVAIVLGKLFYFDYSFERILPQSSYQVTCTMSYDGFGEKIAINTFLPKQISESQSISSLQEENSAMNFSTTNQNGNIQAHWNSPFSKGEQAVQYSFMATTKAIKYQLDPAIEVQENYPVGFEKYTQATPTIQSKHPLIIELTDTLVKENTSLLNSIKKIYDFTYSLTKKPFKGVTDAVTTLRLKEASCNGKSRLFVAMARRLNIPARLVGGLILTSGTKKVSHQWVEVFIGSNWIPFDPLNGHFAYKPSNYLVLYTGDEFLFSHTTGINFDYNFTIKKQVVQNASFGDELKGLFGNSYEVWQAFEEAGIPLELLKIILLLPLGALVVSICRNVIGLKTFGIFLPTLIAISIISTGYWWGILLFISVVLIVSLLHYPLESWGILYTPKLVIMLVFVVIQFILFSTIGFKFSNSSLAYVTLFPVVILTLTAERFARSITEEGMKKTFSIMFQTLLVMSLAYYFINSITMESIFLAFPELFLLIMGIALVLGKWVGLRVSEWNRFRHIIKQ